MPSKYVDYRNYDREARDMIKSLNDTELYRLYEIVRDQQQQRLSETRSKELTAVQRAIEKAPGIEMSRLKSIANGYASEMARAANGGDIIRNNNPKKKKS